MRVTTGHRFAQMANRIADAQEALHAAQRKAITGRRFEQASEAPTDARTVVDSQRLAARLQASSERMTTTRAQLGATDAALSDVGSTLTQARALAVRGANGSLDANARAAIGKEAQALLDRLVDDANAEGIDGRSLFGGHRTEQAPFRIDAGALVYDGDSGAIRVEVSPGETMQANVTGLDGAFVDAFSNLSDLVAAMESDDPDLARETIDKLEANSEIFALARADVGSRTQRLERLSSHHERRVDEIAARVSDLQDVDLTQAVLDLRSAENAYSAALQVSAKGVSTSLMDYLR